MTDVYKNSHRLLQVLLAPVISEKATMLAERNSQFVFNIAHSATKIEVKAAIEMLFQVDVESVKVLNRKPKNNRQGKGRIKHSSRFMGKSKSKRRAIVGLKKGQEINFESTET